MPLQLQIIAIILSVMFFGLTIQLVRKGRAEVRQMRKWLFLAVIMLIGALVPGIGTRIAKMLGIVNLTSLALFTLTENGTNKTIISIDNDSTYTNRIKLGINSGTLQDYN